MTDTKSDIDDALRDAAHAMSVTHEAGTPSARWSEFQDRLAASLARMATDQYLIVSTRTPPDDDSAAYYVQFGQGGPAGFRAEAVSNGYLCPQHRLTPSQEQAMLGLAWQAPDPHASRPENFNRQWPMPAPFAEIAALAVRTLRDVYAVSWPGELVYRRFTRDGAQIIDAALGLAPDPTPPEPPVHAGAGTDLRVVLERGLTLASGHPATPGDDGHYELTIDGISVSARLIAADPPVMRVYAPVMGAPSSPTLLATINELNTAFLFTRALHVNDTVFVALELPAAAVSVETIGWACRTVRSAVVDAFVRIGGHARADDDRVVETPALLN